MPLTEPTDILELARTKVLDQGIGLDQDETLQVLQLGDDRITEILELAHQVRLKWCGEEIEAEGIISLKTGGCPEDCHFCSQSGLFESPVRSAWLNITELTIVMSFMAWFLSVCDLSAARNKLSYAF